MNIATLRGVNVVEKRFTYNLSLPYRVENMGGGFEYFTPIFEVFSQHDFTKVWCVNHREMIKTLGVSSHEDALEELGYIRAVDFDWVMSLDEGQLTVCIEELDLTGDDIDVFLHALDNL